jgi:hypothetical protein
VVGKMHGFWELPKGITEFEESLSLGKFCCRFGWESGKEAKDFFVGKYSSKA